jgi:general secretion pathway protein D
LLKFLSLFLLGVCVSLAAEPSAQALARAASKAQNSGQVVRAYLLYAEAAARDPNNASYRMNRDGLKPLANMLSKAGIEKEPTHDELLNGVFPESEEPLQPLGWEERQRIEQLQPPPRLTLPPGRHNFHSRANERDLFNAVAGAYGLKVVFDPLMDPQPRVAFDVDNVDVRQALSALTETTNTFLFPISAQTIFVARDTQQKRDEYEPEIAVTIPLPDVTDSKMTTEAANAARQAFNLRHIGFDNSGRAIVIRDKLSKAKAARSLLERLIRPAAQIALDVQILTLDDQSTIQYGISLPNTFPIINFGRLLAQGNISFPTGFVNFLSFGGGRTLFGIGVTDAQAFATATQSNARSIYDATVVVSSGETAQMHVGDKFPIATMLYTGASQLPNPSYGPLPQIQQVDLGILIKVKPRLHADGDISMDIHAEYQALGTRTFNTVPEILERQFEGNVRLHTGDVAILAGLATQTSSVTKTGLIGLSEIPKVGDLFTDVNRSHENSQTLLVVKPHSIRDFPVIEQDPYDMGGQYGRKVLL